MPVVATTAVNQKQSFVGRKNSGPHNHRKAFIFCLHRGLPIHGQPPVRTQLARHAAINTRAGDRQRPSFQRQ